jgi:hypothetical protein
MELTNGSSAVPIPVVGALEVYDSREREFLDLDDPSLPPSCRLFPPLPPRSLLRELLMIYSEYCSQGKYRVP